MITRPITRPVTSPIARAVNNPFGNVWNPRALFALGEQGFWYDPNDLSTLYQDAAGTTPVTAAGQPVGLMLDKSKGLAFTGSDFAPAFPAAWAGGEPGTTISGHTVNFGTDPLARVVTNVGGSPSEYFEFRVAFSLSDAGKKVRLVFWGGGVDGIVYFDSAASDVVIPADGIVVKKMNGQAITNLGIRNGSDNAARSVTIESLTAKPIPGNHAFQSTASAKPFVRDTPRRIDYDADDVLNATFPASLGSTCTVARSIPGLGAQILTGQPIGTTFADNVDSCATLVINRALNAAETANLTRFLNQRAGV